MLESIVGSCSFAALHLVVFVALQLCSYVAFVEVLSFYCFFVTSWLCGFVALLPQGFGPTGLRILNSLDTDPNGSEDLFPLGVRVRASWSRGTPAAPYPRFTPPNSLAPDPLARSPGPPSARLGRPWLDLEGPTVRPNRPTIEAHPRIDSLLSFNKCFNDVLHMFYHCFTFVLHRLTHKIRSLQPLGMSRLPPLTPLGMSRLPPLTLLWRNGISIGPTP